MNRSELIESLAQAVGLSVQEAQACVSALFDPRTGIIAEELARGVEVRITGFGKFHVRSLAARRGRVPSSSRAFCVKPKRHPVLYMSRSLKDRLGRL